MYASLKEKEKIFFHCLYLKAIDHDIVKIKVANIVV